MRAAETREVPLSAFAHYAAATTPLAVNHQGQFPAVTISFNLRPGRRARRRGRRDRAGRSASMRPARQHPRQFPGTAQAYQDSLANEPVLIAAALVAVYIVLGVLYESYIHPITILSTLPSAGVGALLALLLFHTDLSVIALIGIILLIGIVKKNAIMMIDFALEAERATARARRGRHLPGLPAALPADHHDHHGGAARRAAAGARHRHRIASCAVRSASPSSAA